jgi:hypothetical protein
LLACFSERRQTEPGKPPCRFDRTAQSGDDDMSKKDLPPVPPAGRTDKGPGAAEPEHNSDLKSDAAEPRHRNIDKQGRQGNIAANTRNQGYQQDR